MGGGGAMADAFIDLGDKLHKNINQSIGVIGGLSNQRQDREQQASQFNRNFAEMQRQNDVENMMAGRNQGMTGIQMLANQRANAMQQFKSGRFKSDLLEILG